MKALQCTENGVALADVPDPEPTPGEVVVKVRSAGICNTDQELARGYMDFRGVLGHEVIGMHAGKRVAMEINCACGKCATCRAGGRNHCPTRTVLGILGRDGGIAEFVRIPEENLHILPDTIPDESAAFIEPLAAALHAFDEAAPRPGDRVCLLGDGKLGLLTGLALAARRGDLGRAVAVGRHRDKLALLEAAGLDVALESEFSEAGFDLVVEATGKPAGLARALAIVKPRGTIILKSTYAGVANVDLAPAVINENKIIGSRCGDFQRAIDVLARGVVDPRPLISARYPLADAARAFQRAAEPGVLKVLVLPS
ncbi:alcohol dehydrogenase catalytic domain-containing protein [Polyangium jinanense]|uniref:Alcohol dehydrogenase catalytic domain-containing protein n=1 Tax=Polyangium jinanense TaxID=2829994 RepID=A0A9X3XC09_9BACT|nr:alcohol dehydrogenase catalytic domain-containing protein [Polyangium jinanense]MDC3955950.1 alcohol dehydrogenase catalytic domain-containing protein [Polyangium jinanense]MDC3985111.1 alcohol dehydrogenase catalytic domain-containing protein [Polyangium jinanense]